MTTNLKSLREFGNYRLDAEKKFLWHNDQPVTLPIKAIELLCVLTESNGEVVTKDELLNRIWTDSFVEESNLSRHIYILRKAFKDLGEERELIETVPRRGYRFAGAVKNVNNNHGEIIVENRVLTHSRIEIETEEEKIVAPPKGFHIFARRTATFAALTIFTLFVFGGAVIATRSYLSTTINAAPPEINSIAVLPLKPIASSDADKVLSLGLADALITNLGNSQKIVVRPVSSVTKYAAHEFDALAVGRELHTDAVLEGSFQRAGDRLRVSVRLLRVADGKQMWASVFNETEVDIFRLQDEISAAAATALALNLNQHERELILKHYTENVEAYRAYQRGRYLFHQYEFENAAAEFERALHFDDKYALAYAGLADVYARMANKADNPRRVAYYEKAKVIALKALALDPNLAEAHAAVGWIYRIYEWNWTESEKHLRRATELAPNVAQNHRLLAFLYITLGRTAEAARLNAQAKQLDPVLQSDAWALYCNRQYEESAAEYVRHLSISDSADVRRGAAMAYSEAGKHAAAIAIIEPTQPLEKDDFASVSILAIALFRSGETEKTAAVLRWLEAKAAQGAGRWARLASVYGVLQQNEKAVEALQKALETRDDRLMWIKVNPHFDRLRDNPRFQEIVRKMNLQ